MLFWNFPYTLHYASPVLGTVSMSQLINIDTLLTKVQTLFRFLSFFSNVFLMIQDFIQQIRFHFVGIFFSFLPISFLIHFYWHLLIVKTNGFHYDIPNVCDVRWPSSISCYYTLPPLSSPAIALLLHPSPPLRFHVLSLLFAFVACIYI